jgi:plastocyanin
MNTNNSERTPGWLLTAVSCGGLLAIALAWLTIPAGANGAATTVSHVTLLADQTASAVVAAVASQPANGTGNFAGVITFDGTVPEPKLLFKKGMSGVQDGAQCAAADMPDESLVLDKDSKGIANVFVYIDKAPAGKKYDPPKEPVVFDQKGCKFLPHALIVRVGQTMLVKSQDNVTHNTHTYPLRSTPKNQAIPPLESKGVPYVYDKHERLPVEVKCDLHKWMSSRHLVLEHPFSAITNEKGEFEVKDLPPGKYEFIIWQESVGYLERKFAVDIAADKVTEKKISFPASKFMK